MKNPARPPFIIAAASCPEVSHKYPDSGEYTGHHRSIGRDAGLLKIGENLARLAPRERRSWPLARRIGYGRVEELLQNVL
ncbi:MAG TPA: hypothetical protein VK884_01230 [Verrucomicrobiae bacterium]|nr:hypothetical protein [Verrucomicrobiae bacterium]